MEDIFTNIKERVLQIAENKGISKEKFFEQIGMTYGNFKGKSKKTPLNSNAIVDISTIYPDVNLEWLLLGKGSMFKKDQLLNTPANQENSIDYKELAEARKETIELLKFKIETLEKELESLKKVHKPNVSSQSSIGKQYK
jgi:hypothetical protein